MRKALVLLTLVCLAASSAYAQTLVAQYTVNKDNYNVNYPGETLWNCGGTTSWRMAKNRQEGTYYGDWTEADLMDLQALLAGPPPTPGWMVWGVKLEWYTTSDNLVGPKRIRISTLDTLSDPPDAGVQGGWEEGIQDRAPFDGACHDYADQLDIGGGTMAGVPWIDVATGGAVGFWDLTSAFVNTADYCELQDVGPPPAGPNGLWLDLPLVMHIINDQNNHGLRMEGFWGEGDDNASNAALGQWGSLGGMKLSVYVIPEPGCLLLLLVAGPLVLRRRSKA